ncbi:MAG TPA: polymer-forming cytoskeletal protein [Candidatus Omnitrophota bacterium]|nr:polymer-forming cytoskeletal protein [Candidatus Omnitrophota bacterium]
MPKKNEELREKILDVDASMQGTISFKDPVNLRINGSFEGKLDTQGNLTIGENAKVKANITGDSIIIAGKVTGDIAARRSLSLVAPALVKGNVRTPVISIQEGSVLEGALSMLNLSEGTGEEILTLRELAQYLEVEIGTLEEWAAKRKIPAFQEDNSWKFKKSEIDRWIQEERLKV